MPKKIMMELACDLPSFGLHQGDVIQVLDTRSVRRAGAYLVAFGHGDRASHDVIRLRKSAASPTGLAVKRGGRWVSIARDVRLSVLGRVPTAPRQRTNGEGV